MQDPDVEADITFFPPSKGGRNVPAFNGYRPAHKVRDDYLTSGIHHYFGRDLVAPGETVRGTIKFITPEVYPHCLWVGKEIAIQEGGRVVGSARITRILNMTLEGKPS